MRIGIKAIFLSFMIAGAGIAAGAGASPPLADSVDLRRAFLERYLDCAEAHSDAARLRCYDDLLADIPDWLDAFETAGIEGEPPESDAPKVQVIRIDPDTP